MGLCEGQGEGGYGGMARGTEDTSRPHGEDRGLYPGLAT